MLMVSRPKIISIVGARPQFIKLAPFARALAQKCRHRIVHTGQHFDSAMSGVFFDQLNIPRADINLEIHGGGHGAMTGRMMVQLEKVLIGESPDLVIVYGDTNSTLAGALTASKLSIPIAHVEAGMRSFVPNMPEEINRRVADHVAQLHFCPTPASVANLKQEGIRKGVSLTGDLMYEQLHDSRKLVSQNRAILEKHGLKQRQYCLLTAHRAGNVDDPSRLAKLVELIAGISLPVLFPLHPRTKSRLKQFKLTKRFQSVGNLIVVTPMNYLDLLTSARFARAVLTDSGGLQKEALFLGTPVLTLRAETEWVETVGKGNHLVDLDAEATARVLSRKVKVRPIDYRIRDRRSGRGQRPSKVMADHILNFLEVKK